MKPTLAARFRGAFPSECAEDVDVVVAMLGRSSHPPSEFDVGPTVVRGERLRIPTRLEALDDARCGVASPIGELGAVGWRVKQATASVLSLAAVVDQLRARYRVETLDAAGERATVRFPEYPDAILGIGLQGQSRLRVTYPKVVAKPSGEYHEVEVTSEGVLPEGLYWIAGQLARHGRVIPEFVRGTLPPVRRNKT